MLMNIIESKHFYLITVVTPTEKARFVFVVHVAGIGNNPRLDKQYIWSILS